MSKSITVTRTIQADGGAPVTYPQTVTVGRLEQISEAIPANQTNLEVNFTADISQSKVCYIVSDVAMTVCTNDDSGGTPAQTLTLVANTPQVWVFGDPAAGKIFTTDVTSLFVTNTTAGTLTIIYGEDPTP